MIKKVIAFTLLLMNCSFADGFHAINGGLSWPRSLSTLGGSDQMAWNFGFDWGGMTDKRIGIGGVMDVMFKNSNEETTVSRDTSSSAGLYETFTSGSAIRRRQFSLGMGMWVNPFNDFVVRPIIRGSFMPSMMVLINEYDDDEDEQVLPPSGAYWGYVATAGIDVHVMVSESVSLFGGMGYRFGSVKKRINYEPFSFDESEEYQYLRQPMDGFSLRFGFHFW